MTDNSTLPVSTGTEVFANKDIGGIKYPRVQVVWGGAGVVNDADSAATKGLPVQMDPAQLGPDIPHGSSDTISGSNPIKVGGQARDTNPTAVTNGSRVNFIADKLGKQIAVTAIREMKGSTYFPMASAVESVIIPAAAGVYRDLYGLVFANTGSTPVSVTIRDSVGSVNVRMFMLVPAGDTRGFTLDCGSAMRQTSINNDWTATCSGISAGNSVHCTALWVETT